MSGLVAFTTTVLTIRFWHGPGDDLPAEELRMLRLVYRQVMADHVEHHAGDALMRRAISGLVKDLDAYSAFVPADKVGAFDSETTGEYQGIGVSMVPARVPITVHFVMEGGPAERAGIGVGDRIVAVDGERLEHLTPENVLEQAQKRLLGAPGSSVRVTVQHVSGHETEHELVRGVQRTSVKWARLLDAPARIGYLHIAAFQQRTAAEFDRELKHLEGEAGGTLAGLILDVRHNPGGLLTEAIAVANRFLHSGTIVTLRARGDVEHARHEADPDKTTHPDLPLVVLVDAESASASEVLCGALQDHERAAVVGVQTFGKGLVQSIYRWDGLDFRLKLTTARYLTPKGRSLGRAHSSGGGKHDGGITPDVAVPVPEATARSIGARLDSLEVPRRYKAAAAALAKELDFAGERGPLAVDADPQLARALAVVRERMAARAGDAAQSPKNNAPSDNGAGNRAGENKR
jgi:carboxyl-terminal processing protease